MMKWKDFLLHLAYQLQKNNQNVAKVCRKNIWITTKISNICKNNILTQQSFKMKVSHGMIWKKVYHYLKKSIKLIFSCKKWCSNEWFCPGEKSSKLSKKTFLWKNSFQLICADEVFNFWWFYGSEKLFFITKLLITRERQKIIKLPHFRKLAKLVANYLAKLLQNRTKPQKVGAPRISTGYKFFYKKFAREGCITCFKGTLMQIRKSSKIFILIWK